MVDYGSTTTVKQMMRPSEATSYGADIDARLVAIQKAVSRRLDQEMLVTFGAPVTDTTEIVYAGPGSALILPVPVRTVTSITTGGTVTAGTVTGGTVITSTEYAYDPIDAQGRILGLRLLSGGHWGVADASGVPLTPVVIVGDFTDTDDDSAVPDDVTYIANLLILRTFQRENTGVAGVSGEDGTFTPPSDPWKDPMVKGVIAYYRGPRVPGF